MSFDRYARIAISVALGLAFASAMGTSAVTAADSPEGAVDELLDRMASGDLGDLGEVVCPAKQDAVREQFGAFDIEVADRSLTLVSEAGDEAIVRLTGTLTIEVEDVAGGLPIDEELTIVRGNGQWLICDGLGEASGSGLELSVSQSGLCGLVPLDELSALGPLRYDASFGEDDFCSFSSSSFEDYHSLNLGLDRGSTIEDVKTYLGGGEETLVADWPAYAVASTDGIAELFVQVEDGTLELSAYLAESPAAEGMDAIAYLAQVAELVIPLLPEVEAGVPRSDGSATGLGPDQGSDEGSLCDLLTVDELNALSPLSYDDASGSLDFCDYSNTFDEDAFHYVSISLNDITLDDFKAYFPDGQDLTVGGRPAYSAVEQLWVELAQGVLAIAAVPAGTPGAEGLDVPAYATQIAEILIPRVGQIASTDPATAAGGATDESSETGSAPAEGSLCDIVSIAEVNALGPIQYDNVLGEPGLCSYTSADSEQSFNSLTIYVETLDLDVVREIFPDGRDVTVAGQPAYTDGVTLWVALGEELVTIVPYLFGSTSEASVDLAEYATQVAGVAVAQLQAKR